MTAAGPVVVGVGNPFRRDDGVGPAVVAALDAAGVVAALDAAGVVAALDAAGVAAAPRAAGVAAAVAGPLDLLGVLDGAPLAIVVDATSSGRLPGTVEVRELGGPPTRGEPARSTHALSVDAVVRLAHELGRAPARTFLVGIEGGDFGPGVGLGPAVTAAVPEAVCAVRALLDREAALGVSDGRCAG